MATPSFRELHFSERELAEHYSVTVRTLKRWRDARLLPYKHIGGRIWYNKQSLANWDAAQEQTGPRVAA